MTLGHLLVTSGHLIHKRRDHLSQQNNSRSNKIALITGSSSGIGRAAVKAFAQEGWTVLATMRRPEENTDAFAHFANVRLVQLDVTDAKSIDDTVALVRSEYGKLDALVNNAGYGLVGAFEELSDEQLRRQFDTNVFGTMSLTRAFIPMMREQGHGRIINISSIGGRIGIPLYTAYHATKFAVEGFTESLDFELRPFGVRAILIEPGAIATDFLTRSSDTVEPAESSAYRSYFQNVMDRYTKVSKTASHPSVVANKIVKVATVERPRLRNPVGGGAEFMMALRKLLPDRTVRALVAQQTGG